jgi:hypothetical protein
LSTNMLNQLVENVGRVCRRHDLVRQDRPGMADFAGPCPGR